jgi:hypothetical protein
VLNKMTRRLLMGSISTYLIHTSSVPVAVIKKQKPKKQEVKQASGAHSLSESKFLDCFV